ncbi:prophage DNA circulation protein [Methylobacterium sp. PvP062]|uniref:Prophage DNA circulation protein n=1 Tax=Methylobacterium radiotolerans TaxID=31998 RepID=A0ABV2NPW6_9HYPH|nr:MULTISPECIES: DNA circularization N-terminal domain-containing protein [unclassified Methylobacterium]MBP2494716.1 prophage DNA circulation protein [Methylobacterium sp. PvP105]MBP2505413.1 prophage DNA circulation protein [Methylobacterium sp. PvP109]MCX7336140.1 DNA circularization N-terminal domain-containing protein [Hyphomicrobiales bacterium]
MSWRDDYRPASFRGVPFHVAANSRTNGRRGFTYEFAKGDRSLDEDLGKRVTRVAVSGYVIGDDYDLQADALEAALNREGGGTLILPTLGRMFMRCEFGPRAERKEEGGIAYFEMAFVDASGGGVTRFGENTQAASAASAVQLADASELSAGTDDDWS